MSDSETPRLFLIDGHALIYRSFFAMIARPLRTSRGENTSAAWGVVNFLLRLQSKYRPEYLIWVLDKGDSFRSAMYPEYKSTREKLDAELQQDFDLALEQTRELLEAFRVPVVAIDGYEADDVIGTLARREAERGLQVVIVSGDKDFYQLIGPRIALLNPGRGGPAGVEEQWVDESNAVERLGVPPWQVIDYLALVGDSSDNVPGVRGVGEKTAAQLLAEFGDLDTILAKAGELKAKRPREALLAEPDQARLSRRLVTIKTDVPVGIELGKAARQEPDRIALRRVLTRLEFHTLVTRLALTGAADMAGTAASLAESEESVGVSAAEARLVDDPAALPGLVARLREARLVAFDVRASSAEPHGAELIGLGLATSPADIWYLPFGHRPEDGVLAAPAAVRNLPPLRDPVCAGLVALLEDSAQPKAGHDVKFDWQVLRGSGVELAGVEFDSMLASFVLDPGRRAHDLDTLSLDLLGRPMTSYPNGRKDIPFAELAVDVASRYCGTDCATVLALEEYFTPRLAETSLSPLLREIEIPLVRVLVDMEWAGIRIDPVVFERLSRELSSDLFRLEAEIAGEAGGSVNLNSPKQLAVVLFEKLGLPILKKTKTGPSTDADVLEQLAEMGHTVPRLLLEYRELQKLKSTYVDVLPARVNRQTGRIHTSFNQTGAATGRLSSSEPNLQNIPVRSPRGEAIRRGFVPNPGWSFVVADYSQIELRLMAHLSGDPAFVAAFNEGEDIHRQTAAIIFGVDRSAVTSEMRAQAKTINFGTIYGQGPFALSKQLGITVEAAKKFIADYFQRFAGVRAYLDRQVEVAKAQGYVETLFKRRRYIPEIKDKNFNTRAFGERLSQNSPLQGSAADLIKIAMVRLAEALRRDGYEARLLLQVHDELVLEAPGGEVDRVVGIVRECMVGVAELKVPLVVNVGVGNNWLEAKH
ncbi:MAG: DNA polymerase I [Gemmatimonadota bacterium]|nr:DNA polymerase I [Gemmatimonadota bacterium]